MKYVKMLALAAVAAGALMAFIGAGTASATVLCSTQVETCPEAQKLQAGTVLDFTIPSGQSALLTNTKGETIDTCAESTVKGKISKVGSSSETTTGGIESLTWSSCTFPTTTLKAASLEIHKIAGGWNGTVTADGLSEVTINTGAIFGSCVYGITSGTSIGDFTEGNPAIFHADAVAHKLSGSSFACPETAKWTATYTLTSPAGTTVAVGSN